MNRFTLFVAIVASSSLLGIGCEEAAPGDPVSGTETNWLKSCEQDADCGQYSCECGVCTTRCAKDDDCSMSDAYCSPDDSEDAQHLCTVAETSVKRLCLRAPEAEPDATADDDASDDDTADDELSDDELNPPASGGSGGEPGSAGGVDGAAEPDDDVGVEPAAAGAPNGSGGSSAPSGSGGSAAPEPEGPVGEGGQTSIGGDGGMPSAVGGSSGAGGASMEVCEFSSCHPEWCDEPGEPCCDPYPGDGPNYCNGQLECQGNSCEERAGTTTPEAQARAACEATGGTWDYQSCGDYSCGMPSPCAAIIAGCNCGFFANFSALGCEPDATCDTASQPFSCGEEECTALGTQYCEEFTSGPGILTYTCHDIPSECLDSSNCECLLDQDPTATDCRIGVHGEWILVPAPAP